MYLAFSPSTPTTSTELVFGLDLTAGDRLPPAIEDLSQPADRTVVEGDSTTFSLGRVMGTEPFSYQWFKDNVAIPDAVAASYTIPLVLVTDAGEYRVDVSNAAGTVSSRTARLSTTAVPVAIADPGEPADRTVIQGQPTTFAIAATGSPLMTYQWSKDGEALPEANDPELVIPAVSAADAGEYWVTVANRLNSVTSRKARLTVLSDTEPPALVQLTGGGTEVILEFTEAVDETTAGNPSLYTLDGGATVQSAQHDPSNPTRVTLSTSALAFGSVYTVTASGVKDLFNNAANAMGQFKATILIDGRFDDWAGIEVGTTEPQETVDGVEFKDIAVASDAEWLFVRFSFYADVGPLGAGHYYHLFVNADNDDQTGFLSYRGNELMIENGGGYQQKNGGFNEGAVTDLDLLLAPQAQASEFECRISRQATYPTDGLPIFAHESLQLYLELISQNWASMDIAPQGFSVFHELAPLPVRPGPLSVRLAGQNVEVSWTGDALLEWRASLDTGAWQPVPNAASPYAVPPTGAARFFRIKRF